MQQVFSKYLILIFALGSSLASYSQTNDYQGRKCFGYQRDSCTTSKNIFYKVHEESRSALFLKGQTSSTRFTIYNGRDYRISLCWDPVLGSQIKFKLIDAQSQTVLYDNATEQYSSEFEFTTTQTRDILIEVTIPGESASLEALTNEEIIFVRKDMELGCVGVRVEHMITPTKGF
ncbi:MAG TPA: hypothetical protein DEQ03_07955 [Marinilabiliales bacterium]|nr:hypothetical protein [Marinilabiliales bacterium]